MCALCRQEERIWQQRTDVKKRLQVQAHGIMETVTKKIKIQDRQIVKPGDNVMVSVPDLDNAKIDSHSLHAVLFEKYSKSQFKLRTF